MSATGVAPRPGIDLIIACTARHYGVTVLDIFSLRVSQRVAVPRHVAMWLTREMTTNSYPAIGRAFGDRDHTTVMAACKRVEHRMESNNRFAADVVELQHEISEASA